MVNEISAGYTFDHWGFIYQPGSLQANDYTQWYRGANNPIINQTLPDPPRLAPYPAEFASTDPLPLLGSNQAIQLPYLPGHRVRRRQLLRTTVSSGQAAATARCRATNFNSRFTFEDDLSIVKGRHSFKFGFSVERNAKTGPGDAAVNGSFNFGDSTSNPLSTNNGYANALLGIYTSYSEIDRRVDRSDTHWLGEGYAQDTWRMTPRLTLDYGVRFTHNGSMFETPQLQLGLRPGVCSRRARSRSCSRAVLHDRRAGQRALLVREHVRAEPGERGDRVARVHGHDRAGHARWHGYGCQRYLRRWTPRQEARGV